MFELENWSAVLGRPAQAKAQIRGSKEYSKISGRVHFYQTPRGVLVAAEVTGLPGGPQVTGRQAVADRCKSPVFAFHIHEGSRCAGNGADPFADVGTHYNPEGCEHPYHAGDLPPLFGNNGYAFMAVLTDRFTVSEIIGKTVIIHGDPDDFHTQPAGNAGMKIACGEIRRRGV